MARWAQVRIYTIRRIWLHLMTQSPVTLPLGIVDSRNNIFVAQLKAPRDRDLMGEMWSAAHLALSE
jgi:hypothetical protein